MTPAPAAPRLPLKVDVLAGITIANQCIVLEVRAFMKIAGDFAKSEKERMVAGAIADALIGLSERILAASNAEIEKLRDHG
jgi:hypothetical protein